MTRTATPTLRAADQVVITVAVLAPPGLVREGLCLLLRADGHDVRVLCPADRTPSTGSFDVATSAELALCAAVVLWLEDASALPLLDAVTVCGSSPAVVTLVPEGATELATLAIRRGAAAVLPTSAAAEQITAAVGGVLLGMACMALPVIRQLARYGDSTADDRWRPPSDQELGWLRSLAAGATVAAVARDAGYPERSFYRRLAETYVLLGATTRTEALLLARRQGLV